MNHHHLSKFRLGFWLAAIYNIVGILIFSKAFTNPLVAQYDPVIFSSFGLISIILWGLAYLSTAKRYMDVPYLLLVFFVEKMLYAQHWVDWMIDHSNLLNEIYLQSPLTHFFFLIYGVGDFLFGVFFLWVWTKRH